MKFFFPSFLLAGLLSMSVSADGDRKRREKPGHHDVSASGSATSLFT
jgi:hypothetical protein